MARRNPAHAPARVIDPYAHRHAPGRGPRLTGRRFGAPAERRARSVSPPGTSALRAVRAPDLRHDARTPSPDPEPPGPGGHPDTGARTCRTTGRRPGSPGVARRQPAPARTQGGRSSESGAEPGDRLARPVGHPATAERRHPARPARRPLVSSRPSRSRNVPPLAGLLDSGPNAPEIARRGLRPLHRHGHSWKGATPWRPPAALPWERPSRRRGALPSPAERLARTGRSTPPPERTKPPGSSAPRPRSHETSARRSPRSVHRLRFDPRAPPLAPPT